MNTVLAPVIREVLEGAHYRPAISIIMPFQPKMKAKHDLITSLNSATHKVEEMLEAQYPDPLGLLVKQKLQALVKDLNFNTHTNSIAIYVSPVFEKLIYLDIEVDEKILIDKSFEIRDLVLNKKQSHKYLLLLLSDKVSRIYFGNVHNLALIVSKSPQSMDHYLGEKQQRLSSTADLGAEKEILRDDFLRYIDNSLDIILNAYPYPLFVLGNATILERFRQFGNHRHAIIDYMDGNFEEDSPARLREKMQPVLQDWQKVEERYLLNQIDLASRKNKLAVGMREVWREAMNRKGKLLVMEKNYEYSPGHFDIDEVISRVVKPYNKYSYKKSPLDDVIEKVLENGGDVEFVEDGTLSNYQQIVLVQN